MEATSYSGIRGRGAPNAALPCRFTGIWGCLAVAGEGTKAETMILRASPITRASCTRSKTFTAGGLAVCNASEKTNGPEKGTDAAGFFSSGKRKYQHSDEGPH